MFNRIQAFAGALLSAAVVLGVAAPGASAEPLTVKHAQGELVLQDMPKRILVQDLAIVDILDALEVPVAGLATNTNNTYPDYLAKYAEPSYLKTGTLKEPDYEAIAAADADLLIVAGRSAPQFRELSRIVPTIDLTADNINLVASVKQNIATLGQLFDKEARAAELTADIDAKFDKLRQANAASDDTAIILVTNAGKLGLYGPNSRVSWIFSEAGFKPVQEKIDDRFHGGDAVSFEYILKADPDWLFVIDRDAGVGQGGAAKKLLDNELVRQTAAWKSQQVVYLDPVDAYLIMHGYRSVTNLADQVLNAIEASKSTK